MDLLKLRFTVWKLMEVYNIDARKAILLTLYSEDVDKWRGKEWK